MQKFDDTNCGGITVTGTVSSCKCEWKDGECKLKSNMTRSIFNDIPFINTCYTSSSAEDCIDESMNVNEVSTVEWDPLTIQGLIHKVPNIPGVTDEISAIKWLNENCNLNDLCPNEEIIVVCGNAKKLSFFNFLNLVFVLIIIFIVYLVLYYKKKYGKKYSDKKKK